MDKRQLWLNKGRVSELLNQKKDVPKALRDALTQIDIDKKIELQFIDYIDDFLEEKNDKSPSIIWKRGKNRITVIEGDLFKFGFDNCGKDKRIQQSLDLDGITPSSTSKSDNTKPHCYSIVTIAVIEAKNCIYYLTAISQFNQNNNAQSSAEDID
ncbi:MAG: DUF6430 domain-containing protein [Lachnospira sp.]|nr:DUF6430 domain-containing protein [Lachnospira sp.]